MMELRHKLPLITTVVIVALIMGTRFVSIVLTDNIGSVDPRVTLPPNQAQEILERQRLQMLIGLVAKISADAIADPSENIGLGPAQQPGQQGRARHAAKIPADEPHIDRHIRRLLMRNQHLI